MNFDPQAFESAFSQFIASTYPPSNPLSEVIEYVLSSRGKRIRAKLALLSCRSFGGAFKDVLGAAIAMEMIHAYSLVHDDLPCMDNDDMRRGMPTAHIKFGEAKAILAGDAILTDAFQLLANESFCPAVNSSALSFEQRLKLIQELAKAAGSKGMVLGQTLDLHWMAKQKVDLEILDSIHRKKTGHLLAAACSMGAICAKADTETVNDMREFGEDLGVAFQIIDDCLDNKDGTGKTRGKDSRDDKLSYLKLMSEEAALKKAAEQTKVALARLQTATKGKGDNELASFVQQLLDRNY